MRRHKIKSGIRILKLIMVTMLSLELIAGTFAVAKPVHAAANAPLEGEIRLFPYANGPVDWIYCAGQVLNIMEHQTLYSIVGNKFGGDGTRTFALPDLRGKEPVEGMGYYISETGLYPSRDAFNAEAMVGEILIFSFNFNSNGWLHANGQSLNSSEYSGLYSIYGNRFGGDGTNNFNLPTIGSIIPGVDYYVASMGTYPSGSIGTGDEYIGEPILFPFDYAASSGYNSWLQSDGRTLNVSTNQALYSLIGNTYGGTAGSTFMLPSLNKSGAPLTYYVSSNGTVPSLQTTVPQPAADRYEVSNQAPLTIPASGGVLSNDSNAVTAMLVDGPDHGTVDFHKDGSFTYSTNTGYIGQDSFTYKASNYNKSSAPVTVTLNISESLPVITGVTDGGYYKQSVTPVFTSGTGRLNGASYPSGITISTEGEYTLEVTNSAGTVTLKFTIDMTAPTVSGVDPGKFYKTNPTITFNEGIGTLDGNTFTNGMTVNSEGAHTLVVTDFAGNKTTVNFTIDKTAPTVTGVEQGGIYKTNPRITFNEGTAELDGISIMNGTEVTSDGTHTLIVKDAAGNITRVDFTVDKTPPSVTGVEPGKFYKGTVTITFNEGNGKLDGDSFASGSNVSEEGEHTLIVTDSAGNETTISFTIDKTAPSVSGVEQNVYYSTDVTIIFNEGIAKLDGDSFTSGNTVSGEGEHTLAVTDEAGNATTVSFTIDKTRPVVTGVAQGASYNKEVTIKFDEGKAVIDGTPFANGTVVSSEGTHTLIVTDWAGNITTVDFVIHYPRTVSFDTNGGTLVEEQTVDYQGTAAAPSDPTKAGFDFEGWYSDSSLRTPFDFASAITADTILYAKWRDAAAPTASFDLPAKDASQVAVSTNLVLTFTEDVIGISGKTIILRGQSDDRIVETIDVTDPSAVSVTGSTYTIHPAARLDYSTGYYVQIETGAFMDEAGNPYAGIDTPDAWSFTTEAAPLTAPLELMAIGGDGQVVLSWGSVTGATYYDIYMGTTAGHYDDQPLNTVTGITYNVVGLTNGTTYYFAVKAGNEYGASPYSNEAAATPESQPLSANANLSGLVPSSGILSPAFSPSETSYRVTVKHGISSMTITPMVADPSARVTVNGSMVTSGHASDNISLSVGANTVTIIVIAQDGTTKTYTVTVKRDKKSSSGSDHSDPVDATTGSSDSDEGDASDPVPQEPSTDIQTAVTSEENGQTVVTATVDEAKLAALLAQEGEKPVISMTFTTPVDKVKVELAGNVLAMLKNKQAILDIQTPNGSYKLPTAELQMESLQDQLGAQADPANLAIHIIVAKSDADNAAMLQEAGGKGHFRVMTSPVEFAVTASYNGKTVSIDKFQSYVEREIPLPDGIDPGQVTTAIVWDGGAAVHQVPTYMTSREGRNYAVIHSLTNSIYALISHSLSFKDMDGHWAKEAVNAMGSRMVINGVDENRFQPNAPISRAEFAAIMVRSLGLDDKGGAASFKDVAPGAWYVGVVAKAQEYGIVQGYEDGTFSPSNTITREEALVMLARAMKLVGLETQISGPETESALSSFTDSISVDEWARQAISAAIKHQVVNGNDGMLMPDSPITRAETAVIVQRMLTRAGLIAASSNTK